MTTVSSEDLTLDLEPVDGDRVPIRLHFRNNCDQTVRLLDLFAEETLPAVLLFTVVDQDGEPVGPMFGGGKVDPLVGGMEYIEIGIGESWVLTVRLADLDPSVLELPDGWYGLAVVYQNQHGEDCFTGRLTATTEIHLPPDVLAKG